MKLFSHAAVTSAAQLHFWLFWSSNFSGYFVS